MGLGDVFSFSKNVAKIAIIANKEANMKIYLYPYSINKDEFRKTFY